VVAAGLLSLALVVVTPGAALASGGNTIVDRFWDSLVTMMTGRLQSQAPVVGTLLEQAEQIFLGPTDDLTLNPAVQDVFRGMRVAGLFLLAFCTVISIAELAQEGIMGTSGGLVGWFRRFFVATLMTFGGLEFYGLWIRLFNGLLGAFRGYLDQHWTGGGGAAALYTQLVTSTGIGQPLLVALFAVVTLLTLIILWFLVGGVRQAELILSIIIAPIVWPVYLIGSLEDIPKTAFRSFLGLNAILLLTVAMLRAAVRMALGPGMTLNIWSLVPALAMLMMTIFLPATIKRIVGQGHTGVGAMLTAVQLASGLKFLTMGVGGAGAAAAAPAAASGAVPQAPSGASAYPIASVPSGASAATGAGETRQARATVARAVPPGAAPPVSQLGSPVAASEAVIDMNESMPGTGRFDQIAAINRYQQGLRSYRNIPKERNGDQ